MLMIFIGAVAVLAVFFLLVMAVDCNRFTIREYHCSDKRLEKGWKIVLLSDLHNKSFGKDNRRLIAAIDGICPDLILVAGDMYTASTHQGAEVAQKLMAELAGRYPIYYGNGNHEHKTGLYPEEYGNVYRDYAEELKRLGIRQLINQRAQLMGQGLSIYGLEPDRKYYQKFKRKEMDKGYLEKLLGRPDPSEFSILIAHNPDYFEEYAAWGADLVVSGHVHGGLMRLPVLGGVISPAMRLFPKYDGGLFKIDDSLMVLSRGLGTHTLPIRIFNPGELVVIGLHPLDKRQASQEGFDC